MSSSSSTCVLTEDSVLDDCGPLGAWLQSRSKPGAVVRDACLEVLRKNIAAPRTQDADQTPCAVEEDLVATSPCSTDQDRSRSVSSELQYEICRMKSILLLESAFDVAPAQ